MRALKLREIYQKGTPRQLRLIRHVGLHQGGDAAQGEILVPGLAFDARGYRLGRGAGHYDRLLPRLRPEVSRWALILDCQWVEDLPVEPHDIPLDGVVSPGREIVR